MTDTKATTATATIPAHLIKSLKASQTKGRAAVKSAWHAIFLAHRATGLGKNPLHRALVKAEIVDYGLSTVGYVISDSASLPEDATVEQVAEAVTAGNLVRNTRTPKVVTPEAEDADADVTDPEADASLSLEADLGRAARQVKAIVATMGQDSLPVLTEVFGDAALATTIYAAITKSIRTKASATR